MTSSIIRLRNTVSFRIGVKNIGLLVQWIEQGSPKAQIWVRFPKGLQKNESTSPKAQIWVLSPKGHDYYDSQRDYKTMSTSKPILPALAVDAACSGNPGVMEFRGVIADTGTEVFHRGPFVEGTNNIGEFLALVLGLAYIKKYNLNWVIYTDSVTALAWVRQKRCKTKIEWSAKNQDLFFMVRKAEMWLHDNTWTTPIYKWDTKAWGEIPADFGRK